MNRRKLLKGQADDRGASPARRLLIFSTPMSAAFAAARMGRSHLALAPHLPSVLTDYREDRRGSVRRTISELAWLNQVRVKYGPAVSLIDLSSGGAQIETASYRLQ